MDYVCLSYLRHRQRRQLRCLSVAALRLKTLRLGDSGGEARRQLGGVSSRLSFDGGGHSRRCRRCCRLRRHARLGSCAATGGRRGLTNRLRSAPSPAAATLSRETWKALQERRERQLSPIHQGRGERGRQKVGLGAAMRTSWLEAMRTRFRPDLYDHPTARQPRRPARRARLGTLVSGNS